MTCLLCPSPAVADCLCVACGAKLWAAKEWEERPDAAAQLVAAVRPPKNQLARWLAIVLMRSEWQRVAFRSDLEAAKAKRAAKVARNTRKREGER